MKFDAAKGRTRVLRAAARILCDDRRAAADAYRRADAHAEPHADADRACAASNPHSAADFDGDRCPDANDYARSERDGYCDGNGHALSYADPKRNTYHHGDANAIAYAHGIPNAYSNPDGHKYAAAQQYTASTFRADGNAYADLDTD